MKTEESHKDNICVALGSNPGPCTQEFYDYSVFQLCDFFLIDPMDEPT